MTSQSASFSQRFRFSDWPNSEVPMVAAGVYAIWENETLIYCGMSGRGIDSRNSESKKRGGLVTRLASHASGRLSGDQFCVYVANRLVIPKLTLEQLPLFAEDKLRLDHLTKEYIHEKLEYQFELVESGEEAFELEEKCRRGQIFGIKPFLNPAD